MATKTETVTPKRAIRRFDVFAEVNRLEALEEGRSEAEAKGHGIWLAKVVAGRRGGRASGSGDAGAGAHHESTGRGRGGRHPEFKSAGGELQTDETFDAEVVERMGSEFYERVFAPAVREALERGEQYEQFRDTIREGWKPKR